MLDKLLSGLKGEIGNEILEKSDAKPEQLDGIFSVIGDVTQKEVTNEITGGGIGNIMNLFSGNQNTSAADTIQERITSGIVENLIEKLGFEQSTARTISNIAVPLVMQLVTKENDTTPEDDPSPIGKLFGGSDSGDMLGGLMDKLF